MSDLTAWQLRGPVRAVRSEWAEWDLANERWAPPSRETLAEFGADGRARLTEAHNPDGSIYRCTNSYDESGLLIQSHAQSDDGPLTRTFHFYDSDSRLIRLTQHDSKDAERLIESWTYAPDGGMTRIVPLRETDYYCAIDGMDFYWHADGAAMGVTDFDGRGLALEVRLQTAGGGLLRRVVLSRNESGRLVKDQLLLGDQPLVQGLPAFGAGTVLVTHNYSYDDRGRRSERNQRLMDQYEEREVFRYDDHDNLVEVTSDRLEHEATVMGDGSVQYRQGTLHRQQTRFAYQYDAHGNWIEKVTTVRRALNPEFTPFAVERRKIDYFPSASGSI